MNNIPNENNLENELTTNKSVNDFIQKNVKYSISTKIIACIVSLILIVSITTSIYIAWQQKKLLLGKMIEKAEYLSKILLTSFSDAILLNQLTTLQNSVNDVKSSDLDIILCEVYDLDFQCIASSNEENRGKTKLQSNDPNAYELIEKAIKTLSTQRKLNETLNKFEVCVPLVIENKSKGCILVSYSLNRVKEEIYNAHFHITIICIIAIIFGLFLSIFLSRKITAPIFDLANGAFEIINNNYDHKITKVYNDETGIIALAFNLVTSNLTLKIKELKEYAENLAKTNAMLDKKINEMKSLQELGKVISSIFNLEELLRAIVQNATLVMKSKRCSIILVNEKSGEFYIKVAKGIDENVDFTENLKLKSGGYVTDYCINQRQSLLVTNIETDERFHEVNTSRYKSKSFVAVPLIINDKVIGMISITEKYNDEPYNESDLQLLQIFANQAVIAIENAKLYEKLVTREKLERELEIAHNIQMSMMPQKYPKIKGISISGVTIPAKEVGGDYYDFLPISDLKIGITIGDVSGKGVPAALMMVMIHSILRTRILGNNNPKDIVFDLNKFMLNELEPRMFITLFYMVLDVETKKIRYTNAGHNYPIVFHSNSNDVDLLKTGGLLLGVIETPTYEEGEYQLSSGDLIIMYTDGIVEAMNEKEEMYGYERFCEFVHKIKHKSADQIKEDILNEIKQFIGDAPQYDDLTLIVIKIEDE